MENAVAADQNNAELRIAYAGLLRDQRNFQGAAQHFWKAAQIKPDSRDAWSGLATMLLSLENYTQALAAFDRLEALGNPNPGMYFLKAIALDKMKMHKPAIEAYRRFLDSSAGKHPDEEFKARQRIKVIEKELSRR
jgi:tetratricopeptide (TPR) repeat protein